MGKQVFRSKSKFLYLRVTLSKDFSKNLMDVTSEKPIKPGEKLEEVFSDLIVGLTQESIRMDMTMSKVERLVQLVSSENVAEGSKPDLIQGFFSKDIKVFRFRLLSFC